jgi:hypothetical protein
MAVKIYIVKIYDPLRQCSSSKVVWRCGVKKLMTAESGAKRVEREKKVKKNMTTETSSRRKIVRCKKLDGVGRDMENWVISLPLMS